jgi:hypothetical protein
MFVGVIVDEEGKVQKELKELSLKDIVDIINEHPQWELKYVEVDDD